MQLGTIIYYVSIVWGEFSYQGSKHFQIDFLLTTSRGSKRNTRRAHVECHHRPGRRQKLGHCTQQHPERHYCKQPLITPKANIRDRGNRAADIILPPAHLLRPLPPALPANLLVPRVRVDGNRRHLAILPRPHHIQCRPRQPTSKRDIHPAPTHQHAPSYSAINTNGVFAPRSQFLHPHLTHHRGVGHETISATQAGRHVDIPLGTAVSCRHTEL